MFSYQIQWLSTWAQGFAGFPCCVWFYGFFSLAGKREKKFLRLIFVIVIFMIVLYFRKYILLCMPFEWYFIFLVYDSCFIPVSNLSFSRYIRLCASHFRKKIILFFTRKSQENLRILFFLILRAHLHLVFTSSINDCFYHHFPSTIIIIITIKTEVTVFITKEKHQNRTRHHQILNSIS